MTDGDGAARVLISESFFFIIALIFLPIRSTAQTEMLTSQPRMDGRNKLTVEMIPVDYVQYNCNSNVVNDPVTFIFLLLVYPLVLLPSLIMISVENLELCSLSFTI